MFVVKSVPSEYTPLINKTLPSSVLLFLCNLGNRVGLECVVSCALRHVTLSHCKRRVFVSQPPSHTLNQQWLPIINKLVFFFKIFP